MQRNHALITPESHVQSPLPGWRGASGIILIAPQLGARFIQYFALLEPGGKSGPPAPGVERFFFVQEGVVELCSSAGAQQLEAGGYAFCPPDYSAEVRAIAASRLLVFEKRFVPLPGVAAPEAVVGHEQEIAAAPFLGDPAAMLKYLLPPSPAADMEVNLFAFAPGASLPLTEVHVMEHGLLLLEGQGIYRLDDRWYPVQAGDVIWMGPFCPQWFAAIGKQPARYLYYKDVNRDPLGGAV
jgi:(S)-ureidoglycine aminohydrolase